MSEGTLAHQSLGRYQLLVAVARGGMGQVWLGRLQGARGFNKLVAVKTLLPHDADRARLEGMLAEEARLASLIQHANVVHTMELGEHEGLLYLVMEWVDGESLAFLLEQAKEHGGMPLGVAALVVGQVLAGLHAAHELSDDSGPLGVVHRDVSPHNILVTYDGVAKLLDFGIAKATQQVTSSTEAGEIKGKFSYMAPEQILGEAVDRRCDVFAAGIVLYLLTTGRHPFQHENTAAVIHAITTDDPVAPPSTLFEGFPAELERVLLKALEKDIARRWASAEEMRAALEQAMPEAFTDAGRTELRAFLERTVGERKAARREAVRRAQLAADARDVEPGARKALQVGSSQSASSLGAISISQPAQRDGAQLFGAQTAERTQVAPPRAKHLTKAPWIAAVAGVSLALTVTLPRVLSLYPGAKAAGAVGVTAGAPLVARESASLLPVAPTPVVATASAAASAELAPAKPAASAPTERRPKPVSASAPAKLKSATTKKSSDESGSSSRDDLLAPDYAH
jgi:serine/threonine protein kinase